MNGQPHDAQATTTGQAATSGAGEMAGAAALLRIFIGERDRRDGRSLYEVIVLEAKQAHLAGATVFAGAIGYGATSVMHHASLLRFSQDLPILIEIVDEEAKLRSFLPRLQALMSGGGLITLERVTVVHYQPHPEPQEVAQDA